MEPNEAPEKIYVPTAGDELHYHMTCPNNEFQESIECTRTDAFIKKAIFYIQQHWIWSTKMIEGFKNYVKGE